jgi:hypothetical protein
MNISSVNGGITFSGKLAAEGRYGFESHNGGITLTVPSDLSARMQVSSFLGEFESELKGVISGREGDDATPRTPRGSGSNRRAAEVSSAPQRMVASDFTIVYGKGEARVTVESFNGAIRVLAAKR